MAAPRLHFVTGKGGVGKSTVAAALALGLAADGARVLALELSPPSGLSRLLGARPGRPSEQLEVADGLWLSFFDGETALAEYLRSIVRLAPFLDAVFAHPLYRHFVGGAPGLRELMVMGKVRDELRQRAGRERRWDAIVVDAGATGHALEHLRMPAVAARTFRSGLVHREAQRIDALLRDPGRTCVHVVALPEEMPLREAAEIIEQLNDLELPIGRLVVNRCRRPAPQGVAEALGALDAMCVDGGSERTAAEAVRVAARRALGWLAIQEEGIASLEWRSGRRVTRLPRIASAELDREALRSLGPTLGAGP